MVDAENKRVARHQDTISCRTTRTFCPPHKYNDTFFATPVTAAADVICLSCSSAVSAPKGGLHIKHNSLIVIGTYDKPTVMRLVRLTVDQVILGRMTL